MAHKHWQSVWAAAHRRVLLFVVLLGLPSLCKADTWTLMIYMNARLSGMDCLAYRDFAQMAAIGSVPGKMEVFVEFGRPGPPICGDNWTGIRRFHVTRDMVPLKGNGTGLSVSTDDLGHGKTVADFVGSTMRLSKTDHYALILWGHGFGLSMPYDLTHFRLDLTAPANRFASLEGAYPPFAPAGGVGAFEQSSNDYRGLHLGDLVRELKKANIPKLDLIAFDACLMGTIENAYGLRDVTRYMVASEPEIMTGSWDYTNVLRTLQQNLPVATPQTIGLLALPALADYGQGFDQVSSFSSLDLSRAQIASVLISNLAVAIESKLANPAFVAELWKVWSAQKPYATVSGDRTVDLIRFARALDDHKPMPDGVRATSREIIRELSDPSGLVVAVYPDTKRDYGVSIFFPASRADWNTFNQINKTYQSYDQRTCNTNQEMFPIEFVCQQKWSGLLRKLFGPGGLLP